MARVARSVSRSVSKPVSAPKPPRVSRTHRPRAEVEPDPPDEDEEIEDDPDVESEEDNDRDEDPENEPDEADEAEEALADDPELSALRAAVQALSGVSHEITVRERYSGPNPRMRALLTYRGQITIDQIESAATIDAAVRLHMNGKPGLYILRIEDPATHTPVSDWQKAVRVAGESPDKDLDEIRRRTERAKANKQLAEAEAELEEVRELRRSPRTDKLLALVERLHARLSALEQPRTTKFDAVSTLLAAPVVVTLVEKLVGRLFAPPPSPAETIKHLVPLLQTNAAAHADAVLLEKKAKLKREELLLESRLRREDAEAGVEPEEPNWLQKTLEIVQAFRGGAGAAPAIAPASRPASARVIERITPFARFALAVMTAYKQRANPIAAAEASLTAWEALPANVKQTFLDPAKALNLFATLPERLRTQAQQLFDGEVGMNWLRELHATFVDLESPDDEGDGAEEAEVVDEGLDLADDAGLQEAPAAPAEAAP